MPRAFLFNPTNDIALGLPNGDNYTPPARLKAMERALAPLLWVVADPEDYIVAPEAETAALQQWKESTEQIFGPLPRFVSDLRGVNVTSLQPWGWSQNALRLWRNLGVPETLSVSYTGIASSIKGLSHRRVSLKILQNLQERGLYSGDLPVEIQSLEELRESVERWGAAMVKAPYSSSGRGVHPLPSSKSLEAPDAICAISGILRQQGSVMTEPLLHRVQDFAMLFRCGNSRGGTTLTSNKEVRFIGYSLFSTDEHGAYSGNSLCSDSEIERHLQRYVDCALLRRTQKALVEILGDLLGDNYEGPLGVDMMIHRMTSGAYAIMPCVELNLRMTMGHVAHSLAQRLASNRGACKTAPEMSIFSGPMKEGAPFLALVPSNPMFSAIVRSH